MTTLYSCKSVSAAEFRITKFNNDYDVLSSYIVSNGGCDCPQGNKPTCRHRKMLPEFAKQGHIDDGAFFDWDTRTWRKALTPLATFKECPKPFKYGELENKLAATLETELSPKAAAVGSASVLPSEPPALSDVEHRAAPSDAHSRAGGSTFKRRDSHDHQWKV